jgi:hypothetical protein
VNGHGQMGACRGVEKLGIGRNCHFRNLSKIP